VTRQRILVVEDERIVGLDLQEALEELGYEVCAVVPSGEEAIERATRDQPDLVLMDIVLAGELDGIDAAGRIWQDLGLPVVFLTAYADDATLDRAKRTGPFGYLVKPFDERELRTTVEMALYRHRMEQELRRSRLWLSTTLRSIGDAVIATGPTGRVQFMNGVAERLTGWPEGEASGRELTEVFDIVNEETGLPAENPVARVLREGGVVGLANHTALLSRDGTATPIADSAAPIKGPSGEIEGVVMVFRDVTEERRAQLALAAEKELLQTTLRSIGDGVIVTDPEGRVTSLNAAARAITGWPEAEARGRRLTEVFPLLDERTREPCPDPVSRVLESGGVVGLSDHPLLVARDGGERSISDSGAPIRDEEGTLLGVVLVFRDVTQRRRIEEELRKVQKLESIGLLAGGIAHDFNNILVAILGNIGYARLRAGQGSEIDGVLADAEKASWRAKDLTAQLLTFSRGGAPVKKTCSAVELVRESVALSLRGSPVHCELDLPEEAWPVEADPGQMTQVFSNLVINARQAMPTGGHLAVRVRNLTRDERRGLLPAGRYVEVGLRDSGIGISPQHLEQIFDPYFSTKQTGSGLGLAICHSIVTRHGGAITVESELGDGTTFRVLLPAATAAPESAGRGAQPRAACTGRLLVMDDDDAVRDLLRRSLGRRGHRVSDAACGEEAFDLYRAALDQDDPFGAVLLDLTIPGGMGGLEALGRLRELDPQVRAMVLSGYSNDPVLADPHSYGFQAALSKPFDLNALIEAVATLLEA